MIYECINCGHQTEEKSKECPNCEYFPPEDQVLWLDEDDVKVREDIKWMVKHAPEYKQFYVNPNY